MTAAFRVAPAQAGAAQFQAMSVRSVGPGLRRSRAMRSRREHMG